MKIYSMGVPVIEFNVVILLPRILGRHGHGPLQVRAPWMS